MYWLTGILGLAMAVAPFALGYRDHTFAMWTSVILGVVVLLASIYEAMDERQAKWEWWVVGIAGVLAVIAPFVFGFTTMTMAFWTMLILGALVFILAGYEAFFVREPV
ncbi:MAG: hypothetical protein DCC55_03270 [Chloroflexi bacterium]|nr:MAG: hypothetical protein DCC55_03270 [Chloroflexota bacterium]